MSLLQCSPESFPSLGFDRANLWEIWEAGGAISKDTWWRPYIISPALASHRTLLSGAKSHGVRSVGGLFYVGTCRGHWLLALRGRPWGFPLSSVDSCPCSGRPRPSSSLLVSALEGVPAAQLAGVLFSSYWKGELRVWWIKVVAQTTQLSSVV